MSYRVIYSDENHQLKERRKGSALYDIIFLILILSAICWPRSRAILEEMLWPGGVAQVHAALETMTESLREGESISQAAEVFCREIIHGGEME